MSAEAGGDMWTLAAELVAQSVHRDDVARHLAPPARASPHGVRGNSPAGGTPSLRAPPAVRRRRPRPWAYRRPPRPCAQARYMDGNPIPRLRSARAHSVFSPSGCRASSGAGPLCATPRGSLEIVVVRPHRQTQVERERRQHVRQQRRSTVSWLRLRAGFSARQPHVLRLPRLIWLAFLSQVHPRTFNRLAFAMRCQGASRRMP
jgi:hypothetical protein